MDVNYLVKYFLQLFVFVVTQSVGQFIIDVIITGHNDTSIKQSQGENIAHMIIFSEQNHTQKIDIFFEIFIT